MTEESLFISIQLPGKDTPDVVVDTILYDRVVITSPSQYISKYTQSKTKIEIVLVKETPSVWPQLISNTGSTVSSGNVSNPVNNDTSTTTTTTTTANNTTTPATTTEAVAPRPYASR